jgi:hypothetical protein
VDSALPLSLHAWLWLQAALALSRRLYLPLLSFLLSFINAVFYIMSMRTDMLLLLRQLYLYHVVNSARVLSLTVKWVEGVGRQGLKQSEIWWSPV